MRVKKPTDRSSGYGANGPEAEGPGRFGWPNNRCCQPVGVGATHAIGMGYRDLESALLKFRRQEELSQMKNRQEPCAAVLKEH